MQEPSTTPRVFVSYAWEGNQHQQWLEDFVARLRGCGIDARLDQWEVRPGDQLPQFMETAIRESDFVLCVCTPRYKGRFDARLGGVGYEAHLMSAEALAKGNERKFIALLRVGEWRDASPSWLLGKKFLDFRGERYPEKSFEELVSTLHGILPEAPGVRPVSAANAPVLAPEAITRQAAYAELANAAFRALSAAKKKILLLKKGNAASRLLLPEVEKEQESAGNRVNEIIQEIHLLSSEPVRKAAGEIVGWVLAARISSMTPTLEPKLDEAQKRLFEESLPRFKTLIRQEQGLR